MTQRPHHQRVEPGTRSQTLDRGLRILETLSAAGAPMSVAALAEALQLHRSIVYRMLRTLEDRRLVSRTPTGGFELGVGLSVLARGVASDLQAVAEPILSTLADEVLMTSFLAVPSGKDAVTLLSVEPHHSSGHIAYASGTRHRLERGAPGMALLAAAPPVEGEREEVARTRSRGWAHSHSEVLSGMSSVAAPITTTRTAAAVAVVYVEGGSPNQPGREELGARLVAAAQEIMAGLPSASRS